MSLGLNFFPLIDREVSFSISKFLRRPQKLTKHSPSICHFTTSTVKISSILVAFLGNMYFTPQSSPDLHKTKVASFYLNLNLKEIEKKIKRRVLY
jgi:hypothetical protein